MEIAFLASGSKGNVTYVNINDKHILIDVGISMKKINERLLLTYGIDLEDIDLVIITHAHGDHILSLSAIHDKYEHIKFIIPNSVQNDILEKKRFRVKKDRLIDITKPLIGKTMIVYPYEINHDVSCFAYKLEDKINKETYLHIADNGGILKKDLIERFKGCTYYAIESNHDLTMQILDEKRNELLKRRVLGYYGHTHNAEAMNLAMKLVDNNTRGIIFHHLSEECNNEKMSQKTHTALISIWGEKTRFRNIDMKYARQNEVVVLA